MDFDEEMDVYQRGVRMGCLLGVLASLVGACVVSAIAWAVNA